MSRKSQIDRTDAEIAAKDRRHAALRDPALVAELEGLLSGRTRDIRLRGRLLDLYRERTFPQSSQIVRNWMAWTIALNLLGVLLNYTFLPPEVTVQALLPGGIIFLGALSVITLYRGEGAAAVQDAGLVAGTFVILFAIALVGAIAGPEFYERYTNIMIFVAITAIGIFSIPLVWTWTIAATALFIHSGVMFWNPLVDAGSALATTLFFAGGLSGTVLARRTAMVLAQKSFLLALRDLKRVSDLAAVNARLETLARTDPLTGVANRRWMTETLDALWHGGTAPGRVAILMCDVDHFKGLNDALGHMEGDRCLREVANVIRDCVRPGLDHVARYGGEEFLVLLDDVDAFDAMLTAERICRTVEATLLPNPGSAVSRYVTVSVGVSSTSPAAAVSADTLQRQADTALYAAKAAGRNRVVSFEGDATLTRQPMLSLAGAG